MWASTLSWTCAISALGRFSPLARLAAAAAGAAGRAGGRLGGLADADVAHHGHRRAAEGGLQGLEGGGLGQARHLADEVGDEGVDAILDFGHGIHLE
jgi:hypothetical protein